MVKRNLTIKEAPQLGRFFLFRIGVDVNKRHATKVPWLRPGSTFYDEDAVPPAALPYMGSRIKKRKTTMSVQSFSQLTDEEIFSIREAYKQEPSVVNLAYQFGRCASTIHDVVFYEGRFAGQKK